MNLNRSIKLSFVLLSVLVLSMAIYGFAAANTVPASNAGDGSGTISGYTVSAIHYNLNATNPGVIDSVTFTLSSAPAAGSTLKIKLVAAGSTWYTCSNTGANVTCNNGSTLGASVATADELRVVVAD
jgi:hypothetical protein